MRTFNLVSENVTALLNQWIETKEEQAEISKRATSQRESLFNAIMVEQKELYIANKENFETRKKFVSAYMDEITSLIDFEKPSQVTVIELIGAVLSNGNFKEDIITYSQANKLIVLHNEKFVTNTQLKKATDKKAINELIRTATDAKKAELKARNEKLTAHLESKTIEELALLIELATLIKAEKIKEVKKAESETKSKLKTVEKLEEQLAEAKSKLVA